MNIKENTFFRTPDDIKEIEGWIQAHNVNERANLYVVMMMTWNYLAKESAKDDE